MGRCNILNRMFVLGRPASLAIGSDSPIPFDRARLGRAARDAFVRDYFRRAGIDIQALTSAYLRGSRVWSVGPDDDRSQYVDVNRDLFAKDEFMVNDSGRGALPGD